MYDEQNSGNWWKRTQESIPIGSYLLSIILYSDATTTDTLGKKSLHPIYLTLGNIINKIRNKPERKQLLAYLPIIMANNESQKKSFEHKQIVRETFHNCLEFLLKPLFNENGLELEINNKLMWFFPRISTIICDWPEANIFSLTYKSSQSLYPCHFCLISKNELSNININSNELVARTHENMQCHYNNNTVKNVSIEAIRNYFWSVP